VILSGYVSVTFSERISAYSSSLLCVASTAMLTQRFVDTPDDLPALTVHDVLDVPIVPPVDQPS